MQLDLVRRHRFTVNDYYRMGEVGLLAREARDELIEGEIFDLPRPEHRQSSLIARLHRLFLCHLDESISVWNQGMLTLSKWSAPRPDLVLLKHRKDDYIRAAPSPEDALLIVEVSENTLRHDWKIKAPLYARSKIPEVWIVDVERPRIHFFRGPEEGHYTRASSASSPGQVSIRALPDHHSVDLTGLLEHLAPTPSCRRKSSTTQN